MNIVPLIVIGALLVVMLVLSNRNKSKRAAADVQRRQAMTVGTRVMTTSGMYGTITAVDPANSGGQADKVTLEIAPGVEVEWALAAVREAPAQTAAAGTAAVGAATTATSGVTDDTIDTVAASGSDVDTPVVSGNGTNGAVRLGKPKGRTVADR